MKSQTNLAIAICLLVIASSAVSVQSAEAGRLETVTEFTDSRGGGITITPNGRIFISMHPLDGPKYRMVEVMANGSKQPFPTIDWADGPEIGNVGFASVIGIHSDSKGVVWILDMGGENSPTQIVAWDTDNNSLHKHLKINQSALLTNSFPQDFVLDESRQKIYIADMSFGNFSGDTKPAIIVVDLKTGESRRVLEGSDAFMPPDQDVVIEGIVLAAKAEDGNVTKLRFGLNPIALDEADEWLYFGAFSGKTLYRMPAAALADEKLSEKKLKSRIQVFGPKNPSDGIAMAPGGGVLVTDLENNAVGLTTKGDYRILVQDKRLSWPDSMAVSNGWVYVTQDQLHLHPAFSAGLGSAKPPYKLMRFRYEP